MAEISNAVGQERISRVVGYQITKGQEVITSNNLPQRVAILGPANTANQVGLGATPSPENITSAQQAAQIYGAGSPIHQMMRILRPQAGGGIGGIPTVVYPQLEAVGATASAIDVGVTGAPNKNIAHKLVVNGRDNVDGEFYQFVIASDDDLPTIRQKIVDAVNAVTNAPVSAALVVDKVTLTTKWKGGTSDELTVTVDTDGDEAGLIYVVDNKISGAGDEDIAEALAQFGSEWNTIVINPYGVSKFSELEIFNGTPSATTPTGRYTGIIFKPFVALYGSIEASRTAIEAITDLEARKDQVTNVHCPAPNSSGFTWEAAANVSLLMAVTSQNSPHSDINGQSYFDMPVPSDLLIGDMADYNNRDSLVKHGSSTVDLVNGKYQVQDMITTYHPDGEIPPQFRYTRNLMLDFNVQYGYALLEDRFVKDKTIVNDDDYVTASNVIKPKEWKGICNAYFDSLSQRALITQPDYSKTSLAVEIGSNPDRMNTFFRYKRTGVARIGSTTAEAFFSTNF